MNETLDAWIVNLVKPNVSLYNFIEYGSEFDVSMIVFSTNVERNGA